MNKKSKFILDLIVNFFLQIIALAALIYTFIPLAKWYLSYLPVWGVDFFLSINLASLINQNPVLPYALWNYAGFGGWPQFLYPVLSAYIISAFSSYFGLVYSAQLMVMGSSLLFIVGMYFLFFRISKSVVISAIFSIFGGLSGGVYQTLTWAGSLPSFASQAALPWTLGFFVWFLRSGNLRLLFFSALIAGVSIWIHPLVYVTYILPSVAIINFFSFDDGIQFIRKIKVFLIFIFISAVIGFPQFYQAFGSVFNSAVKTDYGKSALSTTQETKSQTETDIANFNREQVARIYKDNNEALFIIFPLTLLLFVITTIASLRLLALIKFLPYFLIGLYFGFYIWIFGQGISIYHGGWYRLFWSVPVWIGLMVSALWYESWKNLNKAVQSAYLRLILSVFLAGIFLFSGLSLYSVFDSRYTIRSIVHRSQVSSAYPDALNLLITDNERNEFKKKLVPVWINGDETNYRLYDSDQTVNIWWNSLFAMPLARGYIDPPIESNRRGFLFLLDAALSETEGEPQLVKVFDYPLETAISHALFLVDWNAIRYYEGPHINASFTPLPQYLKSILIKREENVDLNTPKHTKRPVSLNYIEFNDGYYSPILSGTNAPTLGIFGSVGGYENVTRALAERGNLNSQVLIGLNLGKNIDEYKTSELANFDALYLNDYSYKNQKRAFELLRKYLESGKKVYIDTGTEVPETNGNLPGDLFPVRKVIRQGQGREWQLEVVEKSYAQGIDVGKFSPPVFDESEWSISYSEPEDVTSDSKVILKNKGKVIMASRKIGGGEVIWGGFNLAYHIVRNHNYDETMLFQKILSEMVDLNKKPLPESSAAFINPNKRTVKTTAKGVLFKEQAYDGWNAYLINNSGKNSKDIKIYKAGPTYPGFMYLALPNSQQASEVKFVYSGSIRNKILIFISMITVILLFEEVVFRGILLGRLRRLIWHHSKKRVGSWWQKEDEE